jgi:group I intron endonuclease
MSVSNKGKNNPMFGKTHNEETISKNTASRASPPNRIKLEVLDLGASPTDTKTIYNSLREAAKALNTNHRTITNYFTNKQQRPYKGRYIFKKIEGV